MYNTSSNILPTKANRAALIIKSVVDFCIAMAKNDISLLCFIVSAPSIIVSAPSIIVNAPSIIVSAPSIIVSAPSIIVSAPSIIVNAPSIIVNAPSIIVSAPSIIVSAPSIIVNAPSIIVRRIDNLKLYHIIYNLKNQYFFKNKVRWKNEVEKPKYNLPLPDV